MKKVLITRPRAQAAAFAAALSEAGYEPVYFPVIEIHPIEDTTPLDRALKKLGCYDWVVFTSANGVEIFWSRLNTLGIEGLPEGVQVAAIGPKTAEALRACQKAPVRRTHRPGAASLVPGIKSFERSVEPAFIPDEYVAEAILPGLGDLTGRWVLLPRAEIARKALPQAIHEAGGVAHEIAVYRTLPAQPDPVGLEALRAGVDVISFTSPSTVHNFIAIIRDTGLDPLGLPRHPLVACIGPITASAAREEGLTVDLVADEYTTEGLVKALEVAQEITRL